MPPADRTASVLARAARFLGGGAVVLPFSLTFSVIAVHLGWNPTAARTVAFVGGSAAVYLVHRRWSFRAPGGPAVATGFAALYLASFAVAVGVNAATLALLPHAAWAVPAAWLASQSAATALNFCGLHGAVFRRGDRPRVPSPSSPPPRKQEDMSDAVVVRPRGSAAEPPLTTGGMPGGIELLLFSTAPETIRDAVAAGVGGIVVDCEVRGKARRQAGYDTEINANTPAELHRVRAATTAPVICRVNGLGPWSSTEVERVLAEAPDEVLLPMVRGPEEVDRLLALVAGRCRVGVMVETGSAVVHVEEILARPVCRVYVGLNDLRIERRSPSLFDALLDGTVDRVRERATNAGVPFGVAGLTRPDGGFPVPARLLYAELARLEADFTFLRRSFSADTAGRDLAVEVPRMQEAMAAARGRDRLTVHRDRAALRSAVAAAASATAPLGRAVSGASR